jgi:bacteriocin biosynthesis cyclodehydratase domain-containing protein
MRRPVLAPGLRVLQRSREVLQIGLLPRHRVLVPDTEPVRRTLDRLVRGDVLDDGPATRGALDALAPVLVDGAGLVAPGIAEGDVAAAALLDPLDYARRIEARRGSSVAVVGTLGGALDPVPLLSAAGLGVRALAEVPRRGAVLVLAVGEVDRARLDPLVRDGVPHLVVRLVEGTALIGPFVDPGRTACLRCIDAHASLDDPQAGVLVAQHSLAGADRRDGVAEPVDTALATLALAWAVRDLVTHVEGDRPSTWSSTVELGPTLSSVTQTEWLRHPACGCGWRPDEVLTSGSQPRPAQ